MEYEARREVGREGRDEEIRQRSESRLGIEERRKAQGEVVEDSSQESGANN
jgi:hypothetical protein